MNFPYERAAMHNEPMPSGLSQAEQLCYQTLCLLYIRFRTGKITREDGSAEKRKILAAYSKQMDLQMHEDRYRTHVIQLWKDIELAATRYKKDRNVKNADSLYNTIYGATLIKGDDT